jgi:hypothetical protein
MAGSFQHCIKKDGSFDETLDSIENLGDAYEALEEMYDMIVYLTEGDPAKIHRANVQGHWRQKHPERIDEEPNLFSFREFWDGKNPSKIFARYRGTGRTTRQMQRAPHGAIYIVCHGLPQRYRARDIGRDDLEIVTPNWLTDRKWAGLNLTGIVVDHSVWLTEEEQYLLMHARTRIRKTR